EGKVAQMYSSIQTSAAAGMETLDQCLHGLVQRRVISRESAREIAKIPDSF
ncbi:MAG: twitching motility protein PilT, partial [Proteobacteria bacterium]|nr:twitching motility protein PilT [Pseudomonadota bacterium]